MLSLSVCIPTRNEEGNIKYLIQGIRDALIPYTQELSYEVVVVDDSTDKTAVIAKSVGAIVVKGQGKGLGQAIIDGIESSKNDVVLVMDADGSHDPRAIPALIKPIWEQGADLVLGSRYVSGGDYSNWALNRKIKSLVGVKLMQLVTGVRDSNSGLFCFRKSIVDPSILNGKTWKIMLEVLFKGKWVSKVEVPIAFGDRLSGESKRSTKQVFRDAINVIRLLIWKFPKRYVNFAIVGGIGAVSYFAVFWAITEYCNIWYGASYFIATMIAMTQNYIMNHFITFRHTKKSNTNHLKGFVVYFSGSWVGELVEYGVMLFLTEVFGIWYLLSDFIGSGFSSVIKYTVFRKKIWHEGKRTAASADYEWHAFYKGLPWQKRWKRIIASITKEYAEYPDGHAGKLLDWGCGASPQGVLISHSDYVGVDINRDKMEYMRDKNLRNCQFVCALDGVDYPKEYFDTAIFIEVIEHLGGKDEAWMILSNIHKLLKPDGKLVVATPNFGGVMGKWMDRLYGIFQRNAYQKEHQLKFGLESLKALCQEAGFEYITSEIPSGADMVCLFRKVDSAKEIAQVS